MRKLALTTAASAFALSVGQMSPATAQEWTTSTVDPTQPFGEINIAPAGSTPEQMRTFFSGLPAEQQAELTGRCGVVGDAANAGQYEQGALDFCSAVGGIGIGDDDDDDDDDDQDDDDQPAGGGDGNGGGAGGGAGNGGGAGGGGG